MSPLRKGLILAGVAVAALWFFLPEPSGSRCADGWVSSSVGAGTCSGHGGVVSGSGGPSPAVTVARGIRQAVDDAADWMVWDVGRVHLEHHTPAPDSGKYGIPAPMAERFPLSLCELSFLALDDDMRERLELLPPADRDAMVSTAPVGLFKATNWRGLEDCPAIAARVVELGVWDDRNVSAGRYMEARAAHLANAEKQQAECKRGSASADDVLLAALAGCGSGYDPMTSFDYPLGSLAERPY